MPTIQRMVALRIKDDVRVEMLIADRKEPDYSDPQIWMVTDVGGETGQSAEQLQLKALELAKSAITQQIANLTMAHADAAD